MTMDRSPRQVVSQLLLADEDQTTCTFLHDNLTADGYQVETATTSNAALAYLRDAAPDLILVDVNGNTLSLVDHVRGGEYGLCAAAPDTPIIALTSHHEEVHRVRLLERGSDDVIAKPFSYPELRARVDAVLRRTAPRRPGTVITAGPVHVDRRRRSVRVGERTVELRALEYALLCALATEPSRVFTRNELMNAIWGYSNTRTRTLDSHASRLRNKLSTDTHRLVINVWGVGYRLLDDAQP
jgi:DNA-binding response OmpR family regulator